MNQRRRPFPGAGTLARSRALVLEAGVRLPIDDWSSLPALCDTPWLPAVRRVTPGAARAARRRLYPLSAAPITVAAAEAAPRGEVVHLQGIAALLPGRRADPVLWRNRTVNAADGVWLEEQGSDFLLTDPAGGRIVVLAEGGHLLNGDVLEVGDPVSVFGLYDDVPDRIGVAHSSYGRTGLVPALRSGEQQPLLLSRLRRYDPDDVLRK